MALVKTIHFPNGPIVNIWDDDIEPDQEAAWAHAREVHARIHYEIERKKLEEQRKATNAAANSAASAGMNG